MRILEEKRTYPRRIRHTVRRTRGGTVAIIQNQITEGTKVLAKSDTCQDLLPVTVSNKYSSPLLFHL